MSRWKCTQQRCQGAPRTCAIAFFVGVGDAQPDAGQTARPEGPEELAPEALGLALADVEAEHLAPP